MRDPKQRALRSLGATGGCPVCGVIDGTIERRPCVRWMKKSYGRKIRRDPGMLHINELLYVVVKICCVTCSHLAYQKVLRVLSIQSRGDRLLTAVL